MRRALAALAGALALAGAAAAAPTPVPGTTATLDLPSGWTTQDTTKLTQKALDRLLAENPGLGGVGSGAQARALRLLATGPDGSTLAVISLPFPVHASAAALSHLLLVGMRDLFPGATGGTARIASGEAARLHLVATVNAAGRRVTRNVTLYALVRGGSITVVSCNATGPTAACERVARTLRVS